MNTCDMCVWLFCENQTTGEAKKKRRGINIRRRENREQQSNTLMGRLNNENHVWKRESPSPLTIQRMRMRRRTVRAHTWTHPIQSVKELFLSLSHHLEHPIYSWNTRLREESTLSTWDVKQYQGKTAHDTSSTPPVISFILQVSCDTFTLPLSSLVFIHAV